MCERYFKEIYFPPATTDFAILYLPTEGLFAEVTKRSNLVDVVQRDYRDICWSNNALVDLK